MSVRVLGCSGAIAAHSRTTSFLIGQRLLVDAGTGVGDLELDELLRIDDVLLTHSHLDHIAALPLLADSVIRGRRAQGRPPIRVHALDETLAALRRHIFNDVIWPDFTALPDPRHPVLSLQPIRSGQRLALAGLVVEVLPAYHTVPAVGYAIWPGEPRDGGCWVFTGDTTVNPPLWERLRQLQVAQLVIETAFGDDELELARISRHLCPSLLREELARLEQPTQVYITHIKPGEVDAVMSEIGAQASRHQIRALVAGQVMAVGA
jgi:glyoxylase-like metal-dependent hydrolase (beta-lactamase superfamily II)